MIWLFCLVSITSTIGHFVFPGFRLLPNVAGGVVLVDPRLGSIDGVRILLHKVAQLSQAILEEGVDCSVEGWSDVEKKIPVAGDGPGQFLHEMRHFLDVF